MRIWRAGQRPQHILNTIERNIFTDGFIMCQGEIMRVLFEHISPNGYEGTLIVQRHKSKKLSAIEIEAT